MMSIMRPLFFIMLSFLTGCGFWCGDTDKMLTAIRDDSPLDLQKILDGGADPDCPGYDGLTALGSTVQNKNVRLMNILLAHGANVNLLDGGVSPLYVAAQNDCKECAEILIQKGGLIIAKKQILDFLSNKYPHTSDPFWRDIMNKAIVKE